MKEFMFYIRNEKDAKNSLTPEQHLSFIKQCEVYIGELKSKNQLVAAQPIVREGVVIRKENNAWIEKNIVADTNVQVGYYHIMANDLEEAIKIAKKIPSSTMSRRPPLKCDRSRQKKRKQGLFIPRRVSSS